MEQQAGRFVPVTRVGDVGTARVLAALLEAEGVAVRIHSEALGPYPMTVGDLAQAELWVGEDKVEEACAILLGADVNDAVGAVESERHVPIVKTRFVAGVLILILALAVVLRLMRLF